MSSYPDNLVPIPTQPWDERPDALPLDREESRTALWRCRGNVSNAAKLLKVPPSRFRKFVKASPYLTRECEEAREQLADIAEDIVYEALTDDQDKGRQDSMARYVLDRHGRSRGYGAGGTGKVSINGPVGSVTICWADGSQMGNDNYTESNIKVIESE